MAHLAEQEAVLEKATAFLAEERVRLDSEMKTREAAVRGRLDKAERVEAHAAARVTEAATALAAAEALRVEYEAKVATLRGILA
jgi:hypothetical protein